MSSPKTRTRTAAADVRDQLLVAGRRILERDGETGREGLLHPRRADLPRQQLEQGHHAHAGAWMAAHAGACWLEQMRGRCFWYSQAPSARMSTSASGKVV